MRDDAMQMNWVDQQMIALGQTILELQKEKIALATRIEELEATMCKRYELMIDLHEAARADEELIDKLEADNIRLAEELSRLCSTIDEQAETIRLLEQRPEEVHHHHYHERSEHDKAVAYDIRKAIDDAITILYSPPTSAVKEGSSA